MPEYLAPGVYIEEISLGAKPIEGVSTSNAGFLGLTERGPTDGRWLTSFGDYQAYFGGHISDSFTAYAVDGFYRNGGKRCFFGRVVKDGAVKANLTGISPLSINAIGEGAWGNRVGILIQNASLDSAAPGDPPNSATLFKMIIGYWRDAAQLTGNTEELLKSANVLEVYDDMSTETTSANYFVSKINALSNLVELDDPTSGDRPANNDDFIMLENGSDGTDLTSDSFKGDPAAQQGERTGLERFKEIDEINIVYVPDVYKLTDDTQIADLTQSIVAHCENMKDRFAVLDSKQDQKNIADLRPPTDSTYAAFYYPWIKVLDPISRSKKTIPSGGFVTGIYARSDVERGVHKAPANEVVNGALELEFNLTKGDQDLLNPRGVNVIRSFPGRGIRVWGARTISSDPEWKYVNVRRLFLFVEESIEEGTQWVVFEPNNEQLWARVKQTITQFLTTVWRTGALMGTTAEEAFFVKVDRSTMTQADIDNGRLIALIGIAPTKPAEFVIFRIAQFTASANA